MTQEMEEKRLEITDGPAEFDLMVALMRGTWVDFTIAGFKAPTTINGLESEDVSGQEREDGSCKSWLIKGYFNCIKGPITGTKFHGWFSYNNGRKGWVIIDN